MLPAVMLDAFERSVAAVAAGAATMRLTAADVQRGDMVEVGLARAFPATDRIAIHAGPAVVAGVRAAGASALDVQFDDAEVEPLAVRIGLARVEQSRRSSLDSIRRSVGALTCRARSAISRSRSTGSATARDPHPRDSIRFAAAPKSQTPDQNYCPHANTVTPGMGVAQWGTGVQQGIN